jgi:molybdenum cofactor guanylyltransferase
MGREKASLIFSGEPLIVRTIRLLEPRVASVAIVGSCSQSGALGVTPIEDREFGGRNENETLQGPLVGIATALATTRSPWNLILACDLPYLTADWVDWFLNRAQNSAAQVVMPRTSGGLEPLAAAYRRECGGPIATALAQGVRKVTDALEQFQIEVVLESEWRHIDPHGRVLRNMNTPVDYEEARAWLERA